MQPWRTPLAYSKDRVFLLPSLRNIRTWSAVRILSVFLVSKETVVLCWWER